MQSKSVRRLFHRKNFRFLTTLVPDRSPEATRNWVDTDGKHVMINTALGRKVQERFTGPRVPISVVDQTSPCDMVTVRGRAAEQTNIDKKAKKYLGIDR